MMAAVAAGVVAATAFAEGPSPAALPDDRLVAAVEALALPSSEDSGPPHDVANSGDPADAGKAAEVPADSPGPEKRVISVPDQMDRIMTLHEKASRMKGDQTFEGWANDITKRSNDTAAKLGSLIPTSKAPDKSPKTAMLPSTTPNAPPAVAVHASAPLDACAEKSPVSKGDTEPKTEPATGGGAQSVEKMSKTPSNAGAPSGQAESAASADVHAEAPTTSAVAESRSALIRAQEWGAMPPFKLPASAPAITIEAQPPSREGVLREIEWLVREQLRLLEQAHEHPTD
jgi:hypothetical protein